MNFAKQYRSLSRQIGLTAISPSIDLKDRVVLVTGGADGMGGTLSKAVNLYGGTVIAIGIQEEKLQKFEKELGPDKFIGLPCDLMKPINADFKASLKEVCDRFGKIDAYVMNAGAQKIRDFAQAKDLLSTPVDEIRALIQLNALSHLELFQTLHPYLANSDAGRIVATSSSVVGRNDLNIAAYTISKRVLNDVTYHMLAQMKGTNVLVNAYAPPPVQTWLRADYKNEPLYANARAEDIVELPLRLMSADTQNFNDTMFTFVDKRSDTATADGKTYQVNKRTRYGFDFDIRFRSPVNIGAKTEGALLVQSYDTAISRKLTAHGPLPAISEQTPLRSIIAEPPHLTQLRKNLG